MIKKFFCLNLLIVFISLLVGCTAKNPKDEMGFMNINLAQVEKITVSTQMTPQKQDIVIESKDYEELVNKLNAYPLKQITDPQKGWQYLFEIEQKDGVVTLVSFMENRVTVDETVYEVEGYESDDFLYLFE